MPVEFEDKPTIVQVDKTGNHVEISFGGPQGPAGTGIEEVIAATSYTHIQNTPSTTWRIVHNLNFIPSVTIFNSADDQVEADVIHDAPPNDIRKLEIHFSSAISGKAHLS